MGVGESRFLNRVQIALLFTYAAVLPISLTASWVVLICGLVLLALQVLVAAAQGVQLTASTLAGAPLLKSLLIFAAAVALSGLANGGVVEALYSVATLRGVLCYFWAYSLFVHNRNIMHSTVFVLLGVGTIAGVLGTVEQLANFHPFGYRYLQGTGFLGGPMAFAGQMEMLAALSVALLLCSAPSKPLSNLRLSHDKRLQVILYVFAVGNCLGVIFAAERSSWLGFLAALSVISIAVSWRRFIVVMTAVWAFAASSWLVLPVFQKRLLPLLSWTNDVGVRVRLFLWQQAIALWQHSPVFGIGLRKFPHFNIPEAIVPGRSVDINHAHSNYLHILATTGAVGLCAYLWLCLCMLITAWKNFHRPKLDNSTSAANAGIDYERALALGIFGGTIALMVSGIFEYNFGTAHVRLMQWFLLAMLLPTVARRQ